MPRLALWPPLGPRQLKWSATGCSRARSSATRQANHELSSFTGYPVAKDLRSEAFEAPSCYEYSFPPALDLRQSRVVYFCASFESSQREGQFCTLKIPFWPVLIETNAWSFSENLNTGLFYRTAELKDTRGASRPLDFPATQTKYASLPHASHITRHDPSAPDWQQASLPVFRRSTRSGRPIQGASHSCVDV